MAAASWMKNVSVSEMDQREIDRRNKSLNLQVVFQNAKPISNIATMHHFKVQGKSIAAYMLTEDAIQDKSSMPTSSTSSHEPSDTNLVHVGEGYAVDYEGILYLYRRSDWSRRFGRLPGLSYGTNWKALEVAQP